MALAMMVLSVMLVAMMAFVFLSGRGNRAHGPAVAEGEAA